MEGAEPITCDRVLVAVGRKPCTDNLGLAEAGVQTDKRGFIQVNAGYQTTAAGVYAVGDVIGGAMLAHKAEEEGIACVEKMATGHGHINYGTIPAVIYTSPEIASAGAKMQRRASPPTDELESSPGSSTKRRPFISFAANGCAARAAGHTKRRLRQSPGDDEATDPSLSMESTSSVAHAPGELIHEAAVIKCIAMEFGASGTEDIARCCHAHPTLSEAVKEAAMAVDKRAIHS
jgi:dihydrolipoamide dehydrogenase